MSISHNTQRQTPGVEQGFDPAHIEDSQAYIPDLDPLRLIPAGASDAYCMEMLGVNLDRYSALSEAPFHQPIISRKNRDVMVPVAKNFAMRPFGVIPNPMMLTHIVTTRCNYSCGFCCFADTLNAKTNELSLDEIDQVYQTIGDNLNVVVYSGGETTLNKNLPDIIESAYRYTPVKSVYIISNAWKPNLIFEITHRVKQRCPDLHLTWSLSIEGPRQHNNTVRHTKKPDWDAFQNTIDTLYGLKAMRERFGYTELDAQMCTVCTPDNYHMLDEWYEAVRDVLRPDKWNLNLMRRSVQMEDSQLESFDERRKNGDLEPFEEKYIEITERLRDDVISGQMQFLYHTKRTGDGAIKSAVDLLSQEENRRTVTEQTPTFCCRAGSVGAFIGSEGEVSGCEEFAYSPNNTKRFGNLRDVGYDFQAIWHSDKAKEYRTQVGEAPECRGCTLESQRNYPSILVSFNSLRRAYQLSTQIATD